MHSHQYRKHLVERHITPHLLVCSAIQRVFAKIGREKFVPHLPLGMAYSDASLPTLQNRLVLAPSILAKILHYLNPQPEDTTMVVAGGGGYTAALLSLLCSTVFILDSAGVALEPLHTIYEELNISNVIPIHGELKEGLPRQGPFDLIFFDGGVSHIEHSFTHQLKEGGKLVGCILASSNFGEITCFSKKEGILHKTVLFEGFIPPIPSFAIPSEFLF